VVNGRVDVKLRARTRDQMSWRRAMEKKWTFVALGFALLLTGLEFVIDASLAAMIVAG